MRLITYKKLKRKDMLILNQWFRSDLSKNGKFFSRNRKKKNYIRLQYHHIQQRLENIRAFPPCTKSGTRHANPTWREEAATWPVYGKGCDVFFFLLFTASRLIMHHLLTNLHEENERNFQPNKPLHIKMAYFLYNEESLAVSRTYARATMWNWFGAGQWRIFVLWPWVVRTALLLLL